MNKILRLNKDTISKISAGEVILRPSNVVKELIENSIDAASTFIELEVSKGGKDFIRVTDNGCGINQSDLPICIERYTTSKIKQIDDLSNTLTMGFRGEALASIAAVSKMTIISSEGGTAYKMEVEDSKIKSLSETASPRGTTVIIKDLFYNVPVRKKFLKTDQTEMLSITETFIRYVISYPSVHFKLISSGRLLQEYFPQKEFLVRTLSVLRECPKEHMNEFYEKNEYINLRSIASNRHFVKTDMKYIYTFVNGRFVNDRLLKKAITDTYSNILPPQKYPACILFAEIDPKETDINIHPQKTEIRFRDTNRIYHEVSRILHSHLVKQAFNIKSDYAGITKDHISDIREESVSGYNRPYNPSDSKKEYLTTENIFDNAGYFSSLRILGQIAERFIVLCSDNSLVLIDQHAAQERILYNELIKGSLIKKAFIQRMLIPITVELNVSLIERLKVCLDEFYKIGFEIEIFSENTVVIKGIPSAIHSDFTEKTFIDILSSFDEDINKSDSEKLLKEIAAKTACHASVRGHKSLSEIEIRRLLIDMDKTDFSIACPHGRPVYFEITIDEMEKRFERK